MKSTIIFSTLLISTLAVSALQAANLTVIVDNIDVKHGGNVRIGLYSPKEKFLSEKTLQGQEKAVKGKKLTFIFKNLPAGQYAVSSFQDTNKNTKLDTGFLGIPTEPYAFSGKKVWGEPVFKQSSFEVGKKNKTITIKF